MGFKLGNEKRKINMPNGKTPVFRRDLEPGIKAEANNDGSIFVDKSLPVNSNPFRRAIAHELGHMRDMETGRADYGDDWVEWEGKIYIRKTINDEKVIDGPAGRLPEGHPDHPWEASAIKAEEDKVNISRGSNGLEAEVDDGDSPMKWGFGKKLLKGIKNVAQNNPVSMGVRALKGENPIKITGAERREGGGDPCAACEEQSEGGDARDKATKARDKIKEMMKSGSLAGSMIGGGIGGGGFFGAGFAFEKLKAKMEEEDA